MQDKDRKIISRYFSIIIIVGVLGVAILVKAMVIMFAERGYWTEVSEQFVKENVELAPKRGNILSDEGKLMASSIPQYMLFMDFMTTEVNPKRRDRAQFVRDSTLKANMTVICNGLHEVLPDKSAEEFRRTFAEGRRLKSRYYRLYPKRISYAQYKAIKQLPVLCEHQYKGGFFTEENIQRKKNYGSLAQRTLGELYASKDSARYGLELKYDSLLRGTPGLGHRKKVMNKYLSMVDEPPVDGYDVVTTLNVEMQDIAEKALVDKLKEIKADVGVVVVLEVKTGDIKALVNMTRGTDGEYYEMKNNALTDILEPGSTFKTASMVVALEDRMITIHDSVDANGGQYEFGDRVMKDHNWNKAKTYHKLSVPQVLMYSSNVGTARIINEHYAEHPEKYVDRLHQMNLNTNFDILPGEGTPVIRRPTKKNWYTTALPWMSIGYETSIPPINIVAFYNAIANDGVMVKPRLVKAIQKNGEVVKEMEVKVVNPKICSRHTLEDIHTILKMVVNEPDGLGRNAKSEQFLIAGKTGTAQISKGKAGYKGAGLTRYLLSFCGYFPADEPEYSCIVSIQNTGGVPSGGATSGVVFGKIAERIMARNQVADLKEMPLDTTAVYVPSVLKGNIAEARAVLKSVHIDTDWNGSSSYSDGPVWGVAHTQKEGVDLVQETTATAERLPNVIGMGAKDALYRLESCGLLVRLSGVGKVRQQSLTPGSYYRKGQTVHLTLR